MPSSSDRAARRGASGQWRSDIADVRERERRRLAADIHDDVAQAMAFAAIDLSLLVGELDGPPRERADRALANVMHATGALRAIIQGLAPDALERDGLVETLRAQLEVTLGRSGIAWTIEGELEADPSPEVLLAAFRVAQEATANARRHAAPRTVHVVVGVDGDVLALRIADDGSGFELDRSSGGGHGLHLMRERAEAVGGAVEVVSEPGRGTVVSCRIPLG
jgi:signal transduction histidine kinase